MDGPWGKSKVRSEVSHCMAFFDESVTFFKLEVEERSEILKVMAQALYEKGLVMETFEKAVLEREEVFPTGLPLGTYGVAIPHTDAEHVVRSQMAFASLKNPVTFRMMGTGENMEVSLVFMLALKQSDDQLTMLQRLVEIFQDATRLEEFAACQSHEEFKQVLHKVGLHL